MEGAYGRSSDGCWASSQHPSLVAPYAPSIHPHPWMDGGCKGMGGRGWDGCKGEGWRKQAGSLLQRGGEDGWRMQGKGGWRKQARSLLQSACNPSQPSNQAGALPPYRLQNIVRGRGAWRHHGGAINVPLMHSI